MRIHHGHRLTAATTTVFIALFVFSGAAYSAFSAEPMIATKHDALIAASITYVDLQEPEYVRGLETSVQAEKVGKKTYWIVDFRQADGDMDARIIIDGQTGREVTKPVILRKLDGWDNYLERNAFVGDWPWAIAGIVAGLFGAVAVYFWSRRLRFGGWTWLVGGLLWSFVSLYFIGLFWSLSIPDVRGVITSVIPCMAIIVAYALARWQRRGRFAIVELPSGASTTADPQIAAAAPAAVPVGGGKRAGGKMSSLEPSELKIIPADKLPSFADVGGMDAVKDQLRETVGMIVSHGDLVRRYGIDWNGVLLSGPPGVGKTFIAKAAAGEFGLNFIDVRVSDIVSRFAGESTKRISDVFRVAAQHRPCILFFDEFDSVAQRREDASWDTESTRVVNQLLRELENARQTPDLLVMAATNHKDTLDEAVIRAGRFDRHIAINLPDAAARRTIFEARLSGKPVDAALSLDELVALTDGMSAADISTIVNGAALEAVRLSVRSGAQEGAPEQPLTTELLLASMQELRSKVRPTVDITSWDDLVLDPATKTKLMELQNQIERSDELSLHGIEPPRGVLLYGPPGTGKTTIAKVLASQADASFFAVNASELISMWLGESQKHVARLFDSARRSRPSIVFIDEIDSLVPKRTGDGGSYLDDVTSQFLREIDGVQSTSGVFVIGATNLPEALDPALLRGGRLSRHIAIPLPGAPERIALFRVHSKRMTLAAAVDFASLGKHAENLSGADIEEVCDGAAMQAFKRGAHEVLQSDFEQSLMSYRSDRRKSRGSWDASGEDVKKSVRFGFAPSADPGDGLQGGEIS